MPLVVKKKYIISVSEIQCTKWVMYNQGMQLAAYLKWKLAHTWTK